VAYIQEETQDLSRCEVADEPVVASKARPLKASNGVEGKTKPTFAICVKERAIVKSMVSCEGGK